MILGGSGSGLVEPAPQAMLPPGAIGQRLEASLSIGGEVANDIHWLWTRDAVHTVPCTEQPSNNNGFSGSKCQWC